MRLFLCSLLMAGAVSLAAHSPSGARPAPSPGTAPETVALCGARLLTVANGEIAGGTLVITDGKITAVGRAAQVKVPAGARVIDVTGTTITPGLIDAHSHLGLGASGGETEDNESSDPVTPQLRVIDSIHPEGMAPDRDQFARALAEGVTTIVARPGSANVIGGQSAALKLRGGTVDDMVVRFPVDMKMALGRKSAYATKGQMPTTKMGAAYLVRQAMTEAADYKRSLERYEKERGAKPDAEPPARDLKKEAMLKVLDREIPVHVHVATSDDIMTAVRLADEFHFLRLSLVHAEEAWKVAGELAARKVAVVVGPVMVTYDDENHPINLAQALLKRGVEVSITTDADVVQQPFLRYQAAVAVKHGLDPAEALRAITINPARIAGLDARIGTLEPGKDADFVVFDGDPFDIQTRIVKVFIDGRQVR